MFLCMFTGFEWDLHEQTKPFVKEKVSSKKEINQNQKRFLERSDYQNAQTSNKTDESFQSFIISVKLPTNSVTEYCKAVHNDKISLK